MLSSSLKLKLVRVFGTEQMAEGGAPLTEAYLQLSAEGKLRQEEALTPELFLKPESQSAHYGATSSTRFSREPHSSQVSLEEVKYVDIEQANYDSTEILLRLCRNEVLGPYLRITSIIGWSPLFDNSHGYTIWKSIVNKFYICVILALMIFGHFLEYASCFRQDGFAPYRNSIVEQLENSRNFTNSSSKVSSLNKFIYCLAPIKNSTEEFGAEYVAVYCSGGLLSTYLLPAVLHLTGHIFMIFQMHRVKSENILRYLEMIFLQTVWVPTWYVSRKSLISRLRSFLSIGIWLSIIPLASIVMQILYRKETRAGLNYTFMEPGELLVRIALDVFLILCLIINDITKVAVAVTYSFQCQLLITYLKNIEKAVTMRSIHFPNLYKHLFDTKDFLNYLNNQQSLAMSLLCINVVIHIAITLYGLFSGLSLISDSYLIYSSTIVILAYWCILLSIPLFQASRVTDLCSNLKKLAHNIKANPWGYKRKATLQELDSFLLFLSTLKMRARLCQIPVRGSRVLLIILGVFIVLVALGQLGKTYFSSF